MPAVRTRPRDVIVRVTKVEPYNSNDQSSSSNTKTNGTSASTLPAHAPAFSTTTVELVGVPLDGGSIHSSVTAPEKTTDPATAIAAASSSSSSTQLNSKASPTSSQTTTVRTTQGQDKEQGNNDMAKKNASTLGFVLAEREEKEAVGLSKASTSSAEWNSLLVWARRQRGAQWDSATAVWQVDKYSAEYYSFCNDPTQSVQRQPNLSLSGGPSDGTSVAAGLSTDTEATKMSLDENEDDKGPLPRSWRGGSRDESPPLITPGRSARLLRK